jgi:hypothetical protein
MPHLLRSGSFLTSRSTALGLASLRQSCKQVNSAMCIGWGTRLWTRGDEPVDNYGLSTDPPLQI